MKHNLIQIKQVVLLALLVLGSFANAQETGVFSRTYSKMEIFNADRNCYDKPQRQRTTVILDYNKNVISFTDTIHNTQNVYDIKKINNFNKNIHFNCYDNFNKMACRIEIYKWNEELYVEVTYNSKNKFRCK